MGHWRQATALPVFDASFSGILEAISNYPFLTPQKKASEFKMQLSEFWKNRGVKNG